MLDRMRQTVRFATGDDGDRRHAERTAEILRSLGAGEELVLAGLLHDVAKPPRTRLWHRIAGVLLPASLRRRLARGESTLARYLDHARRGADEARRLGASPRVVALIERHHEPPVTGEERLLHRADREALP